MAFMQTIKPQVEFDFNHKCVQHDVYFSEHSEMRTELGVYIKARLSKIGWTQTKLAEEMEVSINAVSKWVRTGKIKRENFFALVAKIGNEGAPHIEEIIEAERRKTDDNAIHTARGKELLAAFYTLPEAEQIAALHGIKWDALKLEAAKQMPTTQIERSTDRRKAK